MHRAFCIIEEFPSPFFFAIKKVILAKVYTLSKSILEVKLSKINLRLEDNHCKCRKNDQTLTPFITLTPNKKY